MNWLCQILEGPFANLAFLWNWDEIIWISSTNYLKSGDGSSVTVFRAYWVRNWHLASSKIVNINYSVLSSRVYVFWGKWGENSSLDDLFTFQLKFGSLREFFVPKIKVVGELFVRVWLVLAHKDRHENFWHERTPLEIAHNWVHNFFRGFKLSLGLDHLIVALNLIRVFILFFSE